MTAPRPPMPGPPGPRPGPPAHPPRPAPPPWPAGPAAQSAPPAWVAGRAEDRDHGHLTEQGTGHAAVDAVLRALANAAPLAPADQIAEFEAAHRVLEETLASIDRS